MSIIIVIVISALGIVSGRVIFNKWVNHLTMYCIIWGMLVFLYQLKLFPYVDIIPMAWFYIISAFISFLLGVITILTINNSSIKGLNFNEKVNITLEIIKDNGKALKFSVIFFSILSLLIAIHSWMLLINLFGSIPAVFINAHEVYRLNVEGDIKGTIPYVAPIGYVAIFFAGIYTAYKGRFSFLSFFPFIGIIIKELATVGRAGMLLALMEFLFSFFLFRNILKRDLENRFKFSRSNAFIASSFLVILLIVSASFVRLSRGTGENYKGISKGLRELKDNPIISPSVYLYLSSDIGVLSQYLKVDRENTKFGQNTFLLVHGFLAKLGIGKKPPFFLKGYYIPIWTNTGTYIRELHADFGPPGVFLVPYLLGLLTTLFWFKFYKDQNLIAFVLLVYFYLIVGFSFLVMVTRLSHWVLSLIYIILYLPILGNLARYYQRKQLTSFVLIHKT